MALHFWGKRLSRRLSSAKSFHPDLREMTDREGASLIGEYEKGSNLNSPQAFQPVRVLVVDDSLAIVRTSALLLQYAGFEVRTASNGRDALKVAAEFHPQVALLDIGLPGLDGYEVARRLRADPTLPMMTLIAITADGTEEDRRRAKAAGFDHHLVKPVHFYSLLPLIGSQSQPDEHLL
jgi:CheY-like chemotaxis protein